MSNEVVSLILLGGFIYSLGKFTIAAISIIAKKPLACIIFGLIDLGSALAIFAMLYGNLFPEFLLQSQLNFIPALWFLAISSFILALLLLFRSAQLMFQAFK